MLAADAACALPDPVSCHIWTAEFFADRARHTRTEETSAHFKVVWQNIKINNIRNNS